MFSRLSALTVVVCIILSTGGCVSGLVSRLFGMQYNENGISHFLVITINEDQPKEYVGTLDGHDVYVEKLDIEGTNFRSVDAENVSIAYAIENGLVSLEDWRDSAGSIMTEGETEILLFQNYEIAVTDDECVIRPISR